MAGAISQQLAVLGAGSWGTALALLLARNNYQVRLWSHTQQHAEAIQQQRCNTRYLPDLQFPDNLQVSHLLPQVLENVTDILVVVPSHVFRQTLQLMQPHLQAHQRIAWGTKGIEPGSNKLLQQVAQEELGPQRPLAVISGPTFAKEVAQGLPGAVTVASGDSGLALAWANALHNQHFRAYTSDDMLGVELGGACKNVMAIAAGAADGLGYGANARAALIARALHEISRLGHQLGAKSETFTGLTGLGDLVLTCTDDQSRNRRTGLALGKGKPLDETVKEIGQVVEGVKTAREVYALAQQHQVDMPITEQVYRVLYENLQPQDAVRALMERSIKAETA